MKKELKYILVMAGLLGAGCESRLLREAEKNYSNYEYATAAAKFETCLASDSSQEVMLQLADCYRKMNRHGEAQKWYSKSINSPDAKPIDKLHYAQELKATGNYPEACTWYDAYLAEVPNDRVARNQRKMCDSVLPDSPYYEISPLKLEVHSSCFSPFLYNGQIYYSAEAPKEPGTPVSDWTGNGYLNLYHVDTFAIGSPMALDTTINSLKHESNLVFAPGGTRVYFTRSAMVTTHRRKHNTSTVSRGRAHTNYLEICSADLVDGKWQNVQVLPFNDPDFSTGQPALVSGGTRMYFVSDRPGGYGGTDIYYADLKSDGGWGTPVNAGDKINTAGNEMFPTVRVSPSGSEELCFSSDGQGGAGGLDIFKCNLVDGLPSDAERMPAPFNSPGDDFGIIYNPGYNSGYFSSNRGSADGDDRIYSFKRKEPLFFVKLGVYERGTDMPLGNTQVEVSNARTHENWQMKTDLSGQLSFPADSQTTYSFIVTSPEFFTGSGSTSTGVFRGSFSDTSFATVLLDKIVINKPIRLANIYYDYDKWNIRPDAMLELDNLVKIMKDNPQIRIELGSHTDCRGSDKYNATLSQKRAESAVNYIVSQGISSDRIYAKGYGETQLLNRCDDGVKCSDEEHQLNRRTEFKVVEILK